MPWSRASARLVKSNYASGQTQLLAGGNNQARTGLGNLRSIPAPPEDPSTQPQLCYEFDNRCTSSRYRRESTTCLRRVLVLGRMILLLFPRASRLHRYEGTGLLCPESAISLRIAWARTLSPSTIHSCQSRIGGGVDHTASVSESTVHRQKSTRGSIRQCRKILNAVSKSKL